jgi:hypothetical protein
MDGWGGGRSEKARDSKMVDGRQGQTVVKEGSRGNPGSLWAAMIYC